MADGNCIGLHWLPISVITLVPLTFLTTFAIAVYLGHIEPDFPYISDTGATPPESCIFGQFLNIAAVLIGITFYVRYKHLEEHFCLNLGPGYVRLNKFCLVLGILSALGISIVGNFQETHVIVVHLCGSVLAFGLGILYMWLQTYISFKLSPQLNSKRMAVFRLLLCIIGTVTFFTTYAMDAYARQRYHGHNKRKWFPGDGGFTYHVISTSSEWVMAFQFLLFFASLVPEYVNLSLSPVSVFTLERVDTRSGITVEEIIT